MNWRKILISRRSWKLVLYALLASYPLVAMTACFFADSIIFLPPGNPYSDAGNKRFASLGEGEKAVAIFHLESKPGYPTILWSHGNAENLESVRPLLQSLNEKGFGAISYDYPGYGMSGGMPTEEGCYRAIEKTYLHLTETLGCEPKDIILAGRSVGSGPTCWLAVEKEHRGVVLISPFLSAFRTVTRIPIFPFDRFPNLKRISKVKTPLLIVHGEEDQIIPFNDGKKLFELSPSTQKAFVPVPKAGHNNIFSPSSVDLPDLLIKFFNFDPS